MGASAWQGLIGTSGQAAGTAGTVTLPANATLIAVYALATGASGSVSILNGTAIPLVANIPFAIDFKHALMLANSANKTVVFSNTASYWVHWVAQGNAS